MRFVHMGAVLLVATTVTAGAAQQGAVPAPQAVPKPDTPEVTAMIAQLKQKVGPNWTDTVHFWCEAPRANRPDDPPIPATEILDGVYAIGNVGTTAFVLRTSAGLVMIDSLGGNDPDASNKLLEDQVLPGFKTLGLDPAQVRMILVTHGHGDHYGTAAAFQQRYGTRVYVTATDWNLIENPTPERARTPRPNHDGEIKDGEPITFGDLSITPVAVPGHTPGSVGFMFPVKDRGQSHVAAVFGGTWLTPGILSNEALQTYLSSVGKFREAARKANVDTLLQNHMLMVPLADWLSRVVARKQGDANPFVVGAAEYQKFLDVMEGCTRVNLARRGI